MIDPFPLPCRQCNFCLIISRPNLLILFLRRYDRDKSWGSKKWKMEKEYYATDEPFEVQTNVFCAVKLDCMRNI